MYTTSVVGFLAKSFGNVTDSKETADSTTGIIQDSTLQIRCGKWWVFDLFLIVWFGIEIWLEEPIYNLRFDYLTCKILFIAHQSRVTSIARREVLTVDQS